MDHILNFLELLLWIGIFMVSYIFVQKFLNSKFMKPEETAVVDTDASKPWNEMKESIIALISRACALSFITILIYFFREEFYKGIKFLSTAFIIINLVITPMFVTRWLDEKYDLWGKKSLEHAYYFLVIFLFIFIAWLLD